MRRLRSPGPQRTPRAPAPREPRRVPVPQTRADPPRTQDSRVPAVSAPGAGGTWCRKRCNGRRPAIRRRAGEARGCERAGAGAATRRPRLPAHASRGRRSCDLVPSAGTVTQSQSAVKLGGRGSAPRGPRTTPPALTNRASDRGSHHQSFGSPSRPRRNQGRSPRRNAPAERSECWRAGGRVGWISWATSCRDPRCPSGRRAVSRFRACLTR